MLNVTVENIGELAVVECEGRIVQSESAYKLREAVTTGKRPHRRAASQMAREAGPRVGLRQPGS
jgi:hypothetical protein